MKTPINHYISYKHSGVKQEARMKTPINHYISYKHSGVITLSSWQNSA